jgi:hypothetical protein
MKKIIGLIAILLVTAISYGQTVVNNSANLVKVAGKNDTITKDQTVNTAFYVSPYCEKASFQVTAEKISGYTKVNYILEKSYDYATWYQIDTVKISSSDTIIKGKMDIKDVNAPYVRIRAVGIDSTQKNRYTYNVILKKAQ